MAVDAVVHVRGQAGVSGGAPVSGCVIRLNGSDVFILFSSLVLFAPRALLILLVSTDLGY